MGVNALEQSLAGHKRLLLDTMIFSYHLAGHPRYAPLTTVILRAVESGTVTGLAITITLAELLTRPAQERDQAALQDYEAYLLHFPNLEIVPLDIAVARETALVRAGAGLRTPDAIQVATARVHGADAVVTHDRRWAGKFARPAVIPLDDFLDADG